VETQIDARFQVMGVTPKETSAGEEEVFPFGLEERVDEARK
jgi:hypothetical protein